jgi:hypothetical protein
MPHSSTQKTDGFQIKKMNSHYLNSIFNIRNYFFIFALAISIITVKPDETSFNDVIQFLPRDYFVKLFFDDVMHTANIDKVQIPFTLQYYIKAYPKGYQELPESNLTIYEKFFHVNRLIGSRTKKLMNIIQLNFKNYIKTGQVIAKRDKTDILEFVRGSDYYHGTNTRSIIIGNEEMYKMTFREVSKFQLTLGTSWIATVVFVFKFAKQTPPLWRSCVIRGHLVTQLVCLESLTVTEEEHDLISISGRDWQIRYVFKSFEFSKQVAYSTRREIRQSQFQTPVEEILANEIFHRSNESLHRSHINQFPVTSSIFLQSKFGLPLLTDRFVVMDEIETNFLSCYSTPVLRFEMYVKPFDLKLWISIVTVLTTISVFIYVYNLKNNLSPSFSPFFFFVSTLFEEPYSVPTALWNDSRFKILTIVWLLTAVIFTNLYTGIKIMI